MSFYSDNVNHQILVALLKAHQIRYVIASPGGTNPALVASFQNDNFFKLYSCVDERSAAYMACGLSCQTNEPVVICCTGATASRNYYPGLTEARYRKIPIIAITCSRPSIHIGHLMPQVTDRVHYLHDIFITSEQITIVKDSEDFRTCEYRINSALLECKRHGGGPVHLNVECINQKCTVRSLPDVHLIKRITLSDQTLPSISSKSVVIFVGSHKDMSSELTHSIESFCEKYNGVVFADHTSGYYGKYKIQYSLFGTQTRHSFLFDNIELLIHIGEVSGDYHTMWNIKSSHVWRINEDGEIRIKFEKLDYIFEMPEVSFFEFYNRSVLNRQETSLYESLSKTYQLLYDSIPNLELSHMQIAKSFHKSLPPKSIVHFAILNALRSWNFFPLDSSIRTSSNVGGFGIDGCMSTLIGASLVDPSKLFFCFIGDLAFFYDMNSLGNRHIKSNIRIIVINDNGGSEFRHFQSPILNVDPNPFVAGSGHFGNQSDVLLRNYAESLGFDYISIKSKEELESHKNIILSENQLEKPLLVEVFSTPEAQSNSWKRISEIANPDFNDLIKVTQKVRKAGIKKIINIIK